MILKGKVFEVGDLEGDVGRGIRIESEGDTIQIIGLTKDACREAAKFYGEFVIITIGQPLRQEVIRGDEGLVKPPEKTEVDV